MVAFAFGQETRQARGGLQEEAGGEGGGEQTEDEGVPEEAARGAEEAAGDCA